MVVPAAFELERALPVGEKLDRLENGCQNICKACDKDVHGCSAGTSQHNTNCVARSKRSVKGKKLDRIRGSSRNALGMWRTMEDFELIDKLGQGFFGTVFKARERNADQGDALTDPIVMKIPILHRNACRVSAKRIVMKEDFMLRLLEHPNILKSRGICVQRSPSEWQLNLLVDFCDGGSLQQLITSTQRPFPWLQRCLIALDVCGAMSYVHGRGFMHRDLTSMNILLQSQKGSQFPKAVVADFGLSSKIPQFPTIFQQVGTQNWMAPEMLKEEFYNEKADIFSFGVIMCQMIARIDADHDAGLYRTPCFGLDYCRFTARCPSETPLTLLKIAFMCCLWNPDSRPSFDVLLDQILELTRQNTETWNFFPRENMLSPGEIRLGRSRSDAAIRGANADDKDKPVIYSSRFSIPSPGLAASPEEQLTKRKTRSIRKHLRKISNESTGVNGLEPSTTIPEGVIMEQHSPTLESSASRTSSSSVRGETLIEKRGDVQLESFKMLAASVANEDPGYQESEDNPFASHARYRSIRKMKPRDSITTHRRCQNSENNSECLSTTESIFSANTTETDSVSRISATVHLSGEDGKDLPLAKVRASTTQINAYKSAFGTNAARMMPVSKGHRARSFSLPSSFVFSFQLDSPEHAKVGGKSDREYPFSPILMKKMSVTLGLGEQRDLQGRITLSFRNYDDKFTSCRYLGANRHAHQKQRSVEHNQTTPCDILPSPSFILPTRCYKSMSPLIYQPSPQAEDVAASEYNNNDYKSTSPAENSSNSTPTGSAAQSSISSSSSYSSTKMASATPIKSIPNHDIDDHHHIPRTSPSTVLYPSLGNSSHSTSISHVSNGNINDRLPSQLVVANGCSSTINPAASNQRIRSFGSSVKRKSHGGRKSGKSRLSNGGSGDDGNAEILALENQQHCNLL